MAWHDRLSTQQYQYNSIENLARAMFHSCCVRPSKSHESQEVPTREERRPNADMSRPKYAMYPHSNLSRCSNRVRTTCLLVSSTSPARNTSSSMAYTYHRTSASLSHSHSFPSSFPLIPSQPPFQYPSPGKRSTYLIKIKHQIQLTHIPKKAIQHLDKEMNGLQIRQLVIVRIDAGAEEEPCVPSVDDLIVPELDEVGLVLLVPGCD